MKKLLALAALLALSITAHGFEIFGVHDGMSADEAKRALKKAFPKAHLDESSPRDIIVVLKYKDGYSFGPTISLCKDGKVSSVSNTLDVKPTWRNFITMANTLTQQYGDIRVTTVQYQPVTVAFGELYSLTLRWRKDNDEIQLNFTGSEKMEPRIQRVVGTTNNPCVKN